MLKLLAWTVLLLALDRLHSVPADPPHGVSDDTLKQLSLDGEKLVDEEVRRTLYGVKQMKEDMWSNEQKHQQLMKSLRHSGDKKKGAAHLARDVTEKLQEAEEACRHSLQPEWEQCRPCLEDACRRFYSSACRRGVSAFHSRVGAFFQRVSERFAPHWLSRESGDILVNQGPDGADVDAEHLEEAFSGLLRRVGALVQQSASLVSSMSSRLDQALQRAFLNQSRSLEPQPTPDPHDPADPANPADPADPLDPARDSGFMRGVGLEEVLESLYDFGRSVVEEFGAVVTRGFDERQQVEQQQKKKDRQSLPQTLSRTLCRNLRRRSSECWKLQTQCEACQGALISECPSVRELHVELDEASQLLEASRDQYQDVLAVVQRHAEETAGWLSAAASRLGWLGRAAGNASASASHVFAVTRVELESRGGGEEPAPDTWVEVNILNSAPLRLSVPGQLELRHPAFIQQVVEEALLQYKEMWRLEEE